MPEGALLPTGTVTFLFTDLHDSTRLWERQPVEMTAAIVRHDELLRSIVEEHGGVVVKSTGDGLLVAFSDASRAVISAIECQRAVQAESWAVPIAVRMGLHTGTAHAVDGDYHAPAVNRAARVTGAAHPGQILSSAATAAVAERVGFRDLGEYTLKGLPPMRLLQVEAEGLERTFPPPVACVPTGGRMPSPLTSFVGRDDDVAAVCRLVDDHCIVTLTGVGGCGKTRLAIEAARRLSGRFVDGVCFADLAPIADEARVAGTVASALGMMEGPTGDPVARLADYVRSRELLIVLDNCEHLLDTCAELIEAVCGQGGRSRLLVTSREPIAIDGEQVHSVRSLVVETEAVRLFADRAAQVRSGFVVDDTNRVTVEEICRRLDGIPLAIELAAVQVAHLSTGQLLERLNDRFRLLVGGRRRVQRQQTLSAALDWSHDTLSAEEQVALRRLAVFPAGFTLEAAQAVIDSKNTLRLVASLRAKSLIDGVDDGARFRYRLLETVRMYAEEKLVDAGEAGQCRSRHRDWVLAWLESVPLEERWFGDDDALGIELFNVRAALEWSAAQDDAVALGRIASGLDWSRGNHRVEGAGWCERAVATDELPRPLRLQLLTMLAVLKTVSLTGDAAPWAERAVACAAGEPSSFLAVALSWHSTILSVRAVEERDPSLADTARRLAAQADALTDDLSPPWQTYCRFVLGMGYASLATAGFDELGHAERYFRTAAEVAPQGPPFGALRAILYEYLALFRLLAGEADAALDIAESAPSGEGHWPMFGQNRSASRMLALAATGDTESARQELHDLHEVFSRSDLARARETVCMYAGALAAIAGDWERAALLLAAGLPGIRAGAEAALVYHHYRRLTRAALGSTRARELRDRGMAMDLGDAIELALR